MNSDPDPRRGLPSASKMARLAECPGSLAMENQIRASGRFFELTDSNRNSGIRIHRWLQLEALGETETEVTLNADQRATAKKCVELRDLAIAQWEALK